MCRGHAFSTPLAPQNIDIASTDRNESLVARNRPLKTRTTDHNTL